MQPTPVFSSLAEAREGLLKLRASGVTTPSRGMSLHQALLHCTQSIDYSLSGFPVMKPKLVRITVGRLAVRHFLAQGSMRHKLHAPVPGAPAIPVEGELGRAWELLLAALDKFEHHHGPLHDHFIFGTLTKEEFSRLHAMHLADHLSAFPAG